MAARWRNRCFSFLTVILTLSSCGGSDRPKQSPPDGSAKPDLAAADLADVAALEVRADLPAGEREDQAKGDMPPAADVSADSVPDADLGDLAPDDPSGDRQDVSPFDERVPLDLASSDGRDGGGEETMALDLGMDTEDAASPDQVRRDLSPVDVPRPDSRITECAFSRARTSLYVPPRFDFSFVQPDGSSLSCATRFSDGGDSTWRQPMTGQVSGWVTAVGATELRVDLCEPGLPCEPAEYRFTVTAPALTLPSIPIGRRVTVSWWMQYGGWACPRMLVVTDAVSADAGTDARPALWLVGVESMREPKLPLTFLVGSQRLYCNSDPDAGTGCGGTIPDDHAFLFAPETGGPPLLLGTSQAAVLSITLGNGTVQHLSLLTLRSFVTGSCDDYSNWAWYGTGHPGADGEPD